MSRTLGIVCLLIIVAVAGWLWLATPEAAAPSTPPRLVILDADQAATFTPSTIEAAANPVSTSEREAADGASAGDGPAIPADAVWLELTVIDAVDKQPVADADVWWSNDVQHNRVMKMPVRKRNAYLADRERITREMGWHARTGADGRVRVTPGSGGASVIAADELRFGQGYFSDQREAPAEGHRLEIAFDRTLLVRVLDAANQPAAGVPVALAQHDPADGKAEDWSNTRQTTDDDGLATFAHVQALQTWPWGPRRGKPVPAWVISIATQGFALEPVTVDAQSPPDEPVELRLPATGHLRAKATFEGEPIPGLANLLLWAGPEHSSNAVNRAWNEPTDEHGWVRFRHLPLGKILFCGNHYWHHELAGPAAPGQEMVATLEVADEVFALSGRLLDAEGRPLVEQYVTTDFDLEVSSGGSQVQTDRDGRFLWILNRAGTRTTAQIKRLAFQRQLVDAPPLRCSVEPREMKVGRNELGDLRMTVDALVVAGQLVFDREGKRWAGMTIERFVASSRPDRDGSWQRVEGLQQVQHPDQRFEVRGGVEPGRYRLAFQAYNHLPVEPVEFVPGAKDLVIEIGCGTPLTATCLLPDGLDAYRLRAVLAPQDASPRPTAGEQLEPWQRHFDQSFNLLRGNFQQQPDGTSQITWQALADGLYTLRFEAPGSTTALLAIPDVVVPPPAGGDPRLHDIDLRETMQLFELTVHSDEQAAQNRNQGILFLLPQPDDGDWQGISLHDAKTVLPVPKGPIDLLLVMEGCQPTTLRGVQGAAEITPRPWPSVEVTFTGCDDLPDGVRLLAGAPQPRRTARDERRYMTDRQSGPLDSLLHRRAGYERVENGKATIPIDDGMQELKVLVLVDRHSKPLQQITPGQVVAGTPVTVQLSADEIRTVADELRSQRKK